MSAECRVVEARTLSGRNSQFGIEIGDDVLESQDRLLYRGDLHQLPNRYRAVTILQGNNEVATLFLDLHERQTVIRRISHGDAPALWMSKRHSTRVILLS